MQKQPLLHVGMAALDPLRVAHKLCVFPTAPKNPDKEIRKAFGLVREWLLGFCLDPEVLLHVGIPVLDGRDLITYDCCIEFPLPIDEESDDVKQRVLPGGTYAVLRVAKLPGAISKAIRQFRGDYIPEHGLVIEEDRPVYEIYYKDTMEYCLPVAA